MIVGLLGGTFNPPHNGHLLIAQQVLDFTDVEEVWFVPGYKHTFQKPAAAPEDRVIMTQLSVIGFRLSESSSSVIGSSETERQKTEKHVSENRKLKTDNKLQVSTLEVDHQLDGNTINLLPFLPKEHTYRFIMGSDQLPTFHLWGDWEKLLKEIPFLVFPRYGYPNEPLYPGMTMVNDSSLIVSNISSTKIRDRVKRGLSIDQFVPQAVEKYIREHELYR